MLKFLFLGFLLLPSLASARGAVDVRELYEQCVAELIRSNGVSRVEAERRCEDILFTETAPKPRTGTEYETDEVTSFVAHKDPVFTASLKDSTFKLISSVVLSPQTQVVAAAGFSGWLAHSLMRSGLVAQKLTLRLRVPALAIVPYPVSDALIELLAQMEGEPLDLVIPAHESISQDDLAHFMSLSQDEQKDLMNFDQKWNSYINKIVQSAKDQIWLQECAPTECA